jgi:cobalt/nickel transport system permease protein
MLNIRQLLIEQPDVVIVNECHGADDFPFRRLPRLLDQFLANQIPESLGTVGITPLRDESIELGQETGVNSNANAAQVAHRTHLNRLGASYDFQSRATLELVHIPDGFLATPVWAALDVAAAPAIGIMARRAQREFDQSRTPLLGVMGGFVFAAQMVNFPVAAGATGHLLGAALLAYTLGPAAASITMAGIIAIQALIFQDGGVLALGANYLNMGVFAVLAGYLPFHLWGSGPRRRFAIFAGGFLSSIVSATLAISELIFSGVRIPGSLLAVSLAVFGGAAVVEGAITVAVIAALEKIQPGFVRRPREGGSWALGAAGLAAILLATAGALVASAAPDGLQKFAELAGISSRERAFAQAPLAGYQISLLDSGMAGKAVAGIIGLALVMAVCFVVGRAVSRKGSG